MNIHRKPLFGGVATAEEVHREVVWGRNKCGVCDGTPVVIEIAAYLPSSVLAAQDPVGFVNGKYGQPVSTFDHSKMGCGNDVYFLADRLYACGSCRKVVEENAAKDYHSTAYVQIDRGPGSEKLVR